MTNDLLAIPAGDRRIQQYYRGTPLDWDILAAHGDIARDQQEDLVKQLGQPTKGLRLLSLVAEPGAGKSTLAWRVAGSFLDRVELTSEGGMANAIALLVFILTLLASVLRGQQEIQAAR